MKRQPLSRGAYLCLKKIKSYDFQRRGWACPNHKTLAEDCNVTTRQIKRYVAELTRKAYLFPKRRPNTSSLYYFGSELPKNVPTKGTQNVPTDVPTDVPTVHIFLKHFNGDQRAEPQSSETPEPITESAGTTEAPPMKIPAMYRGDPVAQKLWHLTQRWITQHPDVLVQYADYARIMHQLEDAGALSRDDGSLPEITFPASAPESQPAGETLRLVPRKPMAHAELVTLLQKIQDSQP